MRNNRRKIKSVKRFLLKIKAFSTEEINSIVKSNSFSSFFDKTTKIVEKALYN
jgi:hypothetical protein